MKILMIIDRYVPIWGGAENQLQQLIPHLKEKGTDISVLTRRWEKGLQKEEFIDGIPVYRAGLPGKNMFATFSYLLGLLKYILKNKKHIDVIHTHGAVALGAVGRSLGYLIHRPNISKIATAKKIPNLQKSLQGRLLIKIFRQSSAIIGMTKEIHNELLTAGVVPEKIKMIKNAVDAEKFQPADEMERIAWRKKKDLDPASSIILFSGRFVKRKGLDILIDIWPLVQKKYPEAVLILLGSGKDQIDSIEEAILQKIKINGIKNILIEGDVAHPENYLSIADILVAPSRAEGLPNTVLEGMASGLIVIGSDIGGTRDLIRDRETGRLFPLEDKKTFARCLCEELEHLDQAKNMGVSARGYVLREHSFSKIAKQYFSTYTEITE